MNNFNLILILAFIVWGNSINAQEFRAGVEMKRKIKPKLETEVKLQLRGETDNEGAIIGKSIFQLNLGYIPIKNIELAGTVRYMGSRKDNSETEGANNYNGKYRVTADATFKTNRLDNNMRISNRLRYQQSITTENKSTELIRNKLKSDFKLTKRVVPYIAVEPYFSLERGNAEMVRLYVGSEFGLIKNRIDTFMIIEINSKDDMLSTAQFFGVMYKF